MIVAEPCTAFRTFLVQVVFGIYLFVACGTFFDRHVYPFQIPDKINAPLECRYKRLGCGFRWVCGSRGRSVRSGCCVEWQTKRIGLHEDCLEAVKHSLLECFGFLYVTDTSVLEGNDHFPGKIVRNYVQFRKSIGYFSLPDRIRHPDICNDLPSHEIFRYPPKAMAMEIPYQHRHLPSEASASRFPVGMKSVLERNEWLRFSWHYGFVASRAQPEVFIRPFSSSSQKISVYKWKSPIVATIRYI